MRRLRNQVLPYAWGSTTEIPRLLGVEPDGRPQAELWLGAHERGTSTLCPEDASRDSRVVGLDTAIAAEPEALLGAGSVRAFGPRLPFLLKILAAEAPLSLQAHPDTEQARAGFAAEEAAGTPRDAAGRNYRDPFHKPEMVVALEPFEALCGFRDPAAAYADIAANPAPLASRLRADLAGSDPSTALRAAFTRLLTLPEQERNALVTGLIDWEARNPAASRNSDGSNTDCMVRLAERYPGDPGAIAALLLNRVRLRPWEALFLPAGNVHAYVGGTAVEIMASSDNVLRAGLTSKHVDVPELLDVVRFEARAVPRVRPIAEGTWWRYPVPVGDFALWASGREARDGVLPGRGARIVLVLGAGAVTVRTGCGHELVLRGGDSAFVAASDGEVSVGEVSAAGADGRRPDVVVAGVGNGGAGP
ncbi:mannose-6-phosphate isomerase [Lipingzhangella halophila]|uniref:mannose-6-phosphate isomerase n=1 Tax=Lipingzhangella halophila TaxID=1783352 RepID=A0A7W7W2V9_9ACTN|nr:mannose-6-phosphate isomerase, class I [Lipingzhangella halophila]MBB4931184.1 mannose-6-phosphate isomerase [Lipingzhangella halophila]